MSLETEAKIRVDSLKEIHAKLERLGAVFEGECLERNWVLDNPEGGLRERGVLLRVRNQGDQGGILTVKEPVSGGAFKSREEVETVVDSTDDLLRQLLTIGFVVTRVYEKNRQTWLWRDCVLALDECPELGFFVEIEGVPERIREVAEALGLDPAGHIEDSYLGLWLKHLEALGEGPRDMVFSGETVESRRNATHRTTRIR